MKPLPFPSPSVVATFLIQLLAPQQAWEWTWAYWGDGWISSVASSWQTAWTSPSPQESDPQLVFSKQLAI